VITRAVRILEVIAEAEHAGLTEIGVATRLPISTVSRIVDSLSAHGLVQRADDTRAFTLGPNLMVLGSRVRYRRDLIRTARPFLEGLAAESQEDAGLSSLQGRHAVIIDRVYGPQPLKIIDVLGEPTPLYCGAFRKVLLAYQTHEWIQQYISSVKLVRFTPRTLDSKQTLREELQRIRADGYAVSFGEKIPDAAGIAAPVFDIAGNLLAAVFIVGPDTRFVGDRVSRLSRIVVGKARELTRALGGDQRGDSSPRAGRKERG